MSIKIEFFYKFLKREKNWNCKVRLKLAAHMRSGRLSENAIRKWTSIWNWAVKLNVGGRSKSWRSILKETVHLNGPLEVYLKVDGHFNNKLGSKNSWFSFDSFSCDKTQCEHPSCDSVFRSCPLSRFFLEHFLIFKLGTNDAIILNLYLFRFNLSPIWI